MDTVVFCFGLTIGFATGLIPFFFYWLSHRKPTVPVPHDCDHGYHAYGNWIADSYKLFQYRQCKICGFTKEKLI